MLTLNLTVILTLSITLSRRGCVPVGHLTFVSEFPNIRRAD